MGVLDRARLTWTFVLVACTRGHDPTASAAPPPAPAVAPAKPAPIDLAITAPSPSTPHGPSTNRFGVRWRVQLPDVDPGTDDTEAPVVIGDEVFVSQPVLYVTHDAIDVFDLATGARRRTAKLVHTRLVAAHGALVASNGDDEFGVDKATLRPTWRAHASLRSAVGDYILETPPSPDPELLRLRRASDGTILWENHERLPSGRRPTPRLDGDTLYVQVYGGVGSDQVAAIDVATGAVRWRTEGDVSSASGGHVVIRDWRSGSVRILDAAGVERWRGTGALVLVRGNVAYASKDDMITAIELSSNRVLWRRSAMSAIQIDDTWLYALSRTQALEIMDPMTGELAGEMQLGSLAVELVLHGPAIRVGAWLFGLGPQPAAAQPVTARACLYVAGCPGSPAAPPVRAKVTIDGTTTATTDKHGCFSARVTLGLGPAYFDVESATAEPLHLDTPFPSAVVFDRAPVTLSASYLGGGCHDASDLR
jgi:outer membrane protein assembly factor BamB